jgi:hypothetical protein
MERHQPDPVAAALAEIRHDLTQHPSRATLASAKRRLTSVSRAITRLPQARPSSGWIPRTETFEHPLAPLLGLATSAPAPVSFTVPETHHPGAGVVPNSKHPTRPRAAGVGQTNHGTNRRTRNENCI